MRPKQNLYDLYQNWGSEHINKSQRQKNHEIFSWTLVFIFFFSPMMISVDTKYKTYGESGSPAAEAPAKTQEKEGTRFITVVEEDAKGGQEKEDNFLEIEETELTSDLLNTPTTQLKIGQTEPAQVYRVNYKNYASVQMPVKNPRISSEFGWRVAPCNGCSSDHQGVDFVPGEGSPIYAVLDGIVVESGYLGGYGYWVKLEHIVNNPNKTQSERWETVYAHMQENSIPEEVTVGSVIKQGEQIGKVGNTGMSTGPHLHFEIRINGEQLDPLPLIANYQETVLEKESKTGEGNKYYIQYR